MNEDNKKKEKMSWREIYRLNRRAVSLWYREYPALFWATGLSCFVNAVVPYITIYFSAQILNELAGERRAALLERQIVTLLLLEVFLLLIKAVLGRWKNTLSDGLCLFCCNQKRFSNKLLSMDFCAVESAATHNLLSEIRQTEMWGNWGMHKVYIQFRELLEEFFRMLGGAALSISLFLLPVQADAGLLVWLNNPLCILLLVLLLAGVTVLSPYLETTGAKCWTDCNEELTFGNRFFGFRFQLMCDEKRALDVRMYRQDILAAQIDKGDKSFTTRSMIAGYARGRMGCAFAASAAVSRIFMGIIYLFVCLKAWGGAFGVGSVTQYIGAITALSRGMAGMLKVLGEAGVNASFLKPTFAFLDIPNEMYQGSLTVEKRSDRNYEVEFRNVSFRYPNTENDVLKNVSLKFKVGERLAVVGQNGSGKTTFIKLLCRLYDPTEGQILLNGIDIRKYNYQEYMNIFSVVFQDFQLLSLPLGQNIAAMGTYDREKTRDCCQKAGLWERVQSMTNGLDTVLYKDLEDEGVQISGGEEQKTAIARALYHDTPFLILDEPTAALDPLAEYEIYTKLNEIVEDRTAIYISHRLSSCRFCDEIIVFHEGSMVQQGSHETLLAQKEGKYSELWNAQAQYYVSAE